MPTSFEGVILVHAIAEMIEVMNWHFGRGKFLRLEWSDCDKKGFAVVQCTSCREERFRFRLIYKGGKITVCYRSYKRVLKTI